MIKYAASFKVTKEQLKLMLGIEGEILQVLEVQDEEDSIALLCVGDKENYPKTTLDEKTGDLMIPECEPIWLKAIGPDKMLRLKAPDGKVYAHKTTDKDDKNEK